MRHRAALIPMKIFVQSGIVWWALWLALCAQCLSQNGADPILPRTGGYSAGAEEAADQLVSLSADKIITILRDEAGLLLQVKRSLVKIAYNQGRVLNADDLTDEALFKLIRNNHDARVLATREIENRSYVRAMPERLEAQQEPVSREVRRAEVQPPQPLQGAPGPAHHTQEDEYWSGHEEQVPQNPAPSQAFPPQPSIPQQDPPVTRSPRSNGPLVERTELDQLTTRSSTA